MKMMKRGAGAILLCLVLAAPNAHAQTQVNHADPPQYVIEESVDNSPMESSPNLDPSDDFPIIDPEAKDVESTTASCGRLNTVPVVMASWSRTAIGSCAILGHRGIEYGSPLKVGYSWSMSPHAPTGSYICAEAFGYYRTVQLEIWDPPPTTKSKWYKAGCGTGGSVTVNWGNVSDVKKMRFFGSKLNGATYASFWG